MDLPRRLNGDESPVPRLNTDPKFPHLCGGDRCAICRWLTARTWQALLHAKAKDITRKS